MPGKPVGKQEQTYARLRDRILTGVYAPGQKLSIKTIANEMGMSPMPVREAIRRLEAEGWVVYERYQGADADGSWLVTAPVPGRSAVDPRWIARPAAAATAIGRGLRAFHDRLPVAGCPFDWSIERRLAHASTDLGAAPPIDRLVVCHGDACAPNTLLLDDGTVVAHVDLGTLGVADRWADLAVAAWSTEWNYGPGYDGLVYSGYGVAPDAERIAYYRRLWDAG